MVGAGSHDRMATSDWLQVSSLQAAEIQHLLAASPAGAGLQQLRDKGEHRDTEAAGEYGVQCHSLEVMCFDFIIFQRP